MPQLPSPTPPLIPTGGTARWKALGVLAAALLAGGLLRVWLALHDDGIYWPDEIFQSLEPAHRLVFHYGLIPWEFIDGARSWTFPGLLAGVLKLTHIVGLPNPRGYLTVVRVGMSLLSVSVAYGSYFLARRLGATPLSAAVGAALWALPGALIYFGPRALNETAACLPIVFGLGLAAPKEAKPWERWLGASLLGFSVFLRLQAGIFCVGLLVIELSRRRWRPFLEAAAILLGWGLLFGLLDRLTWGDFFHSAIAYLKFNVVEGKSAQWGTADSGYFVNVLFRAMPIPMLAWVVLGALGLLKRPGVGLTALAFFIVHTAVPHKELRFILPVLPLFCSYAALGLDVVAAWQPKVRGVLCAFLLFACAVSASRFHDLVFHDIGAYEEQMPQTSAYDMSGPVNRLLLAAHDAPDLCGLRIEVTHLAWTGGFTYLHREVPLYGATQGPPRTSAIYNYVITVPRAANGAEVVATDGPFVLARLFSGPCQPNPNYSWKLP